MDSASHIAVVRVIGVIDLKGGKAVHARGGSRELYEPVLSALLSEHERGDAAALARSYRDRLGLAEIYVADLDRIVCGGALSEALGAIVAVGLPLMVDAGITTVAAADLVLAAGASRIVVGLETLTSLEVLTDIVETVGASRIVFSLDLRNQRPVARASSGLGDLDASAVAEKVIGCGVASLILLDLARVGHSAGPDLPLIDRVRRLFPAIELIAGGGVRDLHDIERLASAGCDGVLIGTALHRLTISGPV